MSPGQLPLALFATGGADLEGYYPGSNSEALKAVEAWAGGDGPWCVGLWGKAGVGKSHLLQAAVRAAGDRGARAMYIPLRELAAQGLAVLEDLEAVEYLCMDDIDLIAGDIDWERALFRLYNASASMAGRLMFACTISPTGLGLALRDLQSRLTAALVYHLRELSESEKQQALAAEAARRGLVMPEAVVNYIMSRCARDLAGLLDVLSALDRASMIRGRPLTIPFVREVLKIAEPE